jgi:hypothetical protein
VSFAADFYFWGHDPEPMARAEMLEYIALLRTIGQRVEAVGKERELILLELEQDLGRPLDEDDVETVDTFLAGL